MFHQFTRENRMTLVFAYQEAADLGHTTLGNDHLILGMLCNARTSVFNTLGEQGLTLAQAREVVREYHDSHEVDPDKEQVAEDKDALAAIGIDLDKVREAVKTAFGDDITDNWGKRRGGRGGLGRGGPGGRGGPEGRGERGHRHGGPRGRRGEGPWERPSGDGPWERPEGDDGAPWERGGPWEGGRGRRGPRGGVRRPRFSKDAKTAISHAALIARDADRELIAEDVLLGILTTGDAASKALIESVTTAEAIREAVQRADAQ
ncbi:MAG: Clp protease [Gordonia sp.]|nr:Clp protease N-terminal domain-containing protein [Williamsia sp. 1138]MBA4022865.1 Clp protease [Gordonia sp. (in: high G+C Gram-positive bacteria)]OZG29084.1 Clp protease [Williamsia sp. 1138]